MTNRILGFLFFGGSLLMSACAMDKSENSTEPSALVSVYALSPDAASLNIFLNDNNIAAYVPTGTYTTYSQVTAGETVLRAQTASQDKTIDTTFSTKVNTHYSIFLIDSISKLKSVFVKDSLRTATDTVYVRFFNFSPGAPAVNIYGYSDSANRRTFWSNRAFGNAISDTVNTFVGAKRGTYSFAVISSTDVTDTLAKFSNINLASAGNYTLLLEGAFERITDSTTSLQLGLRQH